MLVDLGGWLVDDGEPWLTEVIFVVGCVVVGRLVAVVMVDEGWFIGRHG